ncbi:hypothetical protein TNCV_795771 [Trichonephila clavipes]|nr:hypothetical protein TNCV_795771 [Trichonephila clavipes]
MDLPPPVSQKSYERILRKINLASREIADDSMKNAAKEEVSASGSNEICVSGDGTWKPRGRTSHIGVCSVVGVCSVTLHIVKYVKNGEVQNLDIHMKSGN